MSDMGHGNDNVLVNTAGGINVHQQNSIKDTLAKGIAG